MNQRWRELMRDYGVAVVAVLVALVVRYLLHSYAGERAPFVTFFLALIFAAWFGGFGPALAATLLSALLSMLFFLPPVGIAVHGVSGWVSLASFLVVGFTCALLGGQMHVARKKAEEEHEIASRQHEELKMTLASIGDAVIATDVDGKVTWLNQVAVELTGWAATEAIGRPLAEVFQIINETTRLPVENPALRALKEGSIVGLANHTLLICKDGTERPIDDSAAPIKSEKGKIVGSVLIFRDISAKKKLEDRELYYRGQAAKATAQFEAFFEQGPLFAVIMDVDGTVVQANRKSWETGGYGREQFLGTRFSDLPWWSPSAAMAEQIEHAWQKAAAGTSFRTEIPYFWADGSERLLDIFILPIKDETGEVIFLASTATDITDTHRTATELQVARSRLESTLAASEIGTWQFDPVNNLVNADANLKNMFQVDSETFEATPLELFIEAIHPDDRGRVTAEIEQALADGQSFESEYRILRPDGVIRWVVARGRVERDDSGKAISMPGVVVDISERRLIEEERTRLVSIVENSLEFIGTLDVQGTPQFLNEAGRRLVGLPLDYDISQLAIVDFFMPEERRLVEAVAMPTMNDQGQWSGEMTFRHFETGEPIPVLFDVFRVDDPKTGQPINFATISRDISEQKKIAATLRKSEEQRRLVLDAAELGSWNIDTTTNEMIVDERFELIFQGHPGGITYEEAFAAIHPDDRNRVRDAVAAATQLDNPAPYAEEYRVIHSDGTIRWVFGKGRANFEETESGRRLVSFDGTVMDITEQHQMREDLQAYAARLSEADRRKDEFLATLAHELRNPLAPIRTGLEALELAEDDPEMRDEIRQTMKRQTEQLVHLVDDLLDVSRITRGRLKLRLSRVELADIIRNAVEATLPVIEEAGHEFEQSLSDEPIWLDADPTRLAQVLSNLLNNAAKYTKAPGRIRLYVERQENDIVIGVQDNGIGVPDEMKERIFDMFGQVDNSWDSGYTGLGIGLTLVKSLVAMHGGTVEVQSEGVNQGSDFRLRLPLVPTERQLTPTGDQPTDETATSAGRKVLVVDDNLAAANMLEMLIKMLGHQVCTANDGKQAIEVAADYLPEIILMDIGMPKMNGYDAARHIRNQPWGKDMTLVALTGWGQAEDKNKTKAAGFDHHLVKPADPTQLEQLLAGP